MSTKKYLKYTLPRPNEHGNYILGLSCQPPAIYLITGEKSKNKDKYMVSLPEPHGVLFNKDHEIRGFDTPEEALAEINRILSR